MDMPEEQPLPLPFVPSSSSPGKTARKRGRRRWSSVRNRFLSKKNSQPLTPPHEHDTRHKTNMHNLANVLTEVHSIAKMRLGRHASENRAKINDKRGSQDAYAD